MRRLVDGTIILDCRKHVDLIASSLFQYGCIDMLQPNLFNQMIPGRATKDVILKFEETGQCDDGQWLLNNQLPATHMHVDLVVLINGRRN